MVSASSSAYVRDPFARKACAISRNRAADSARRAIHDAYVHRTNTSLSDGKLLNFGRTYSPKMKAWTGVRVLTFDN